MNSRGGSKKWTPLHYASLNNHVAVATTLLAAGASECARDAEGLTPLNLSMGGDMCKLLHKVTILHKLVGCMHYCERAQRHGMCMCVRRGGSTGSKRSTN